LIKISNKTSEKINRCIRWGVGGGKGNTVERDTKNEDSSFPGRMGIHCEKGYRKLKIKRTAASWGEGDRVWREIRRMRTTAAC